jgi:ribosomal protein S18 acetylase RimI-like enzyme
VTTYAAHDAEAAAEHAEGVWALYDEVFGDLPDETSWRTDLWDRHRGRAGFRLVTAYDEETAGLGALLGFAWAYVGERGQWWSDRVVEVLPRGVTDVWVGGHLEVVELATAPAARGQGIGGRLLDLLVADRGARPALLSTSADESDPAVRLYRSHGWTTLGLLGEGVQVMGLSAERTRADLRVLPRGGPVG